MIKAKVLGSDEVKQYRTRRGQYAVGVYRRGRLIISIDIPFDRWELTTKPSGDLTEVIIRNLL